MSVSANWCYSLTLIPSPRRYFLRSQIPISPKWKTLAANAASAFPKVKASRKCSLVPAPPDAMMGMPTSTDKRARAS